MMNWQRCLVVRLLILALSAGNLFSQTERGNITGQVNDPSGAAVPSAEVVAIHVATNLSTATQTTAAGEYNIPVSPGVYRVTVFAAGFKRYAHDNVTVAAASTVRLDAVLEIGAVSESVEVSADVLQIQTGNAKVSSSVQNRLVDELPLVVGGALRSPFDLVSIAPESRGSGNTLALGGGQAAAWDATIDGLSVGTSRAADASEIAHNTPSLEAITEFTVDTNGFKAEYGQAGGGVMTFSSKSGTNDLHGVAYDFLRNDDLDARDFFARTRPVYKQNDFGATLSGPVYFPRLYNGKNQTFFFIAFEGFRNRVGSNAIIMSVPTPEMFQGDFSKWVDAKGQLLQIYDPSTTRPSPSGNGFVRDPFPNNQIPMARFSAFSRLMMPYGQVVTPNRPGIVPGTISYVQNNYVSNSGTVLTPTDKGSAKIDHVIHNNHRLGFLFNITRNRQEIGGGGPPGLPLPLWDGRLTRFSTEVYRLSYDWTVSPRVLNHLSVGGNHLIKSGGAPNNEGKNWKDKLCMKNVVDCNVNFPIATFTEFRTWGSEAAGGTEQPHWDVKEDLSYTRGKHIFKMGYAFQSLRANGLGEQLISGRADFSFVGTSVPAATSFTSGNSFASFLLGDANSGGTDTFVYTPQLYRYHGLYVQDDWHVAKRLTLNLGVRYDFTLPPINLLDQYSDFTPDRPNPAVNNYPGALRFAGFGPGRENRRSLVPSWYGGIGPRIGLAYSVGGKTTVRAAFGRSFSRVTVVSGSGHDVGFSANYRFNSSDQGVTPAFNWDVGLPPWLPTPQINPTFANNQNVPYWQPQDAARAPEDLYWTLSVQRQVSPNIVLEMAYNATVGTHLQTGLVNINQTPTAYLNQFIRQYGTTQGLNLLRADINSAQARAAGIPVPYPIFTDPRVQQLRTVNQALRPYPQYQTVSTSAEGDKSGHSSYHALVVKVERRFSAGLTFQWNYSFLKLLTDSDTYLTGGLAQDQYNRRLEKSIGRFDQTHVLKLNTLYELPVGKGKKFLSSGRFARQLLGGWRLGAIQSYASGFPIALTRNNPLPIFNGPTRPMVTSYTGWRAPTAGSKFDPNVDKFLNIAAFPAQPVAGLGNVTRYNPKLRSFPLFNENVSLAKSFHITESKRFDFRWEAFNLFNRTLFGNPNANLNSSTFGVVSMQANTPRQMQGALKFYW